MPRVADGPQRKKNPKLYVDMARKWKPQKCSLLAKLNFYEDCVFLSAYSVKTSWSTFVLEKSIFKVKQCRFWKFSCYLIITPIFFFANLKPMLVIYSKYAIFKHWAVTYRLVLLGWDGLLSSDGLIDGYRIWTYNLAFLSF